ncbi:uncharacterized protein [Prorops nasuta]|uniref:uncharacterized protein n=1 Tax=Prorops nasuta TaxID=863751 RepID=UPI0034CEBB48
MTSENKYINEEQKKLLVDFMEKHPELQSGKFSKEFTHTKARNLWEEIAALLNQIPGANKPWDKWRKSWHDMKSQAKVKSTNIKNYAKGTGGGPATTQELNESDKSILALISSTAIVGIASTTESAIDFDWNNEMETTINNEILEVIEDRVPNKDLEVVMQNKAPIKAVKRTCSKYEKSIKDSEQLIRISEEDCESRKAYYTKKLKLYDYEISLKEREVAAKEKLVNILKIFVQHKLEE